MSSTHVHLCNRFHVHVNSIADARAAVTRRVLAQYGRLNISSSRESHQDTSIRVMGKRSNNGLTMQVAAVLALLAMAPIAQAGALTSLPRTPLFTTRQAPPWRVAIAPFALCNAVRPYRVASWRACACTTQFASRQDVASGPLCIVLFSFRVDLRACLMRCRLFVAVVEARAPCRVSC